jgi:uncharacterized protein YkwD
MTRVRTAALLALLACALALPATASAESPRTTMLQKVNQFRANHGVKKLRYSRSLSHSAQAYARRMMRSGYFGHSSRIHASGRYRTLGEVIEMHRGKRARVALAYRNWLNSPGHRGLLISSQFNAGGAGFVTGRFQGRRQTMWVMHFGHP